MRKAVDLFLLYTIVKRLSQPFTEWQAFKVGVIDKDGNILIEKGKRSGNQRDALSAFDILILNIKKLLDKVPGGSKIATYGAALYLLREQDVTDEDMALQLAENFAATVVPANNIGDGKIADPKIAGLGNKRRVLRRKKIDKDEEIV